MRESKGNGRRRLLSKEQRADRQKAIVADLKNPELSYREIAQKHGVSLPTVNNVARRAGISRGRRPGARILVPRAARKRGPARKATKKAGVRRGPGRPRKTNVQAAPAATAPRRGRPPGRRTAKTGARRGRPPGAARRGADFQADFRALVLRHYPDISLSKFERLMQTVESEMR